MAHNETEIFAPSTANVNMQSAASGDFTIPRCDSIGDPGKDYHDRDLRDAAPPCQTFLDRDHQMESFDS